MVAATPAAACGGGGGGGGTAFEQRRAAAMTALYGAARVDRSRKGCVDAPVEELCARVNSSQDYYTTSSCSGRLALFQEPRAPGGDGGDETDFDPKRKRGGGEWLYLEHGLADAEAVVRAASCARDTSPHAGPLTLRFEPFILAVECRSAQAAAALVAAAVGAGLRESGIAPSNKRHVCSVRCSVRLEVPVALNGELLVSDRYLRTLVRLSNGKMHDNWARIERFEKAFDHLTCVYAPTCSDIPAALGALNVTDGAPATDVSAQCALAPPAALAVRKRCAKAWKDALKSSKLLDRSMRVPVTETEVVLPIAHAAAAGVLGSAASGASTYGELAVAADGSDESDADVRVLQILAAAIGLLDRVSEARVVRDEEFGVEGGQGDGGRSAVLTRTSLTPRDALRVGLCDYLRAATTAGTRSLDARAADALAAAEAKALRWEMLGDVAMLSQRAFTAEEWAPYIEAAATAGVDAPPSIWEVVARALGCNRLARQAEIDASEKRHSRAAILYARSGAAASGGWTEVRDNGVVYGLDVTQVMYSSGNGTEKRRMGDVHARGETVVDLFAGIGYFTIPLLRRAGVAHLVACEWNAPAAQALRHNLRRNGVEARCEVREGDNRKMAPKGVAHRVLLGLIPTSEKSWHTAVEALRPEGGILHVHANVRTDETQTWARGCAASLESLATARSCGGPPLRCIVQHIERVKSYAPRVDHIVVDVACYPKAGMAPLLQTPGVAGAADAARHICPKPLPARVRVLEAGERDVCTIGADLRHGMVPAVITGLKVLPAGPDAWSPERMAASACAGASVTVHECNDTAALDFVGKNFKYVRMGFGDFVRKAAAIPSPNGGAARSTQCLYLRSVGRDSRSDRARLEKDFPDLAQGVALPSELYAPERYHSSILRVTSPGCSLWPHFDVMENALVQLRGSKRVLLFPPAAATSLGIAPDSSSTRLLDEADMLAAAQHMGALECVLRPGDTLYIPALWVHAVATLDDFSVSANVFWRGLAPSELAAKDLYGNRDPVRAEAAASLARQAGDALAKLPEPYRAFYGERCTRTLRQRASCSG